MLVDVSVDEVEELVMDDGVDELECDVLLEDEDEEDEEEDLVELAEDLDDDDDVDEFLLKEDAKDVKDTDATDVLLEDEEDETNLGIEETTLEIELEVLLEIALVELSRWDEETELIADESDADVWKLVVELFIWGFTSCALIKDPNNSNNDRWDHFRVLILSNIVAFGTTILARENRIEQMRSDQRKVGVSIWLIFN